ncbi:D-ribose ABC transporter substrate-binding protein [Steroidobacter agaridevorans]|uniref:D-ribose ABC transporter substrate-binding protein n=1 Tax=Steroidobacter agaridevorans TaxID=2695856 RepID=UPI00132C9741|nr:D-ribose ABC transporter substrate-binding protein [Steroidobacter agaridevorans]GFE87748.1 D-ribose ABC transporter substrate-binding protein [Steroidobacter agaridevorans]
MRALRSVIGAVAGIILACGLVACSRGPAESTPAPAPGAQSRQIAVVVSTLNNPWFVVLANTARDEAQRRNYKVTIFDSQNDPAKEAAHFENIVASRYAAVLLNATDAEGSVANVMKARVANIPVFTMDREINSRAPVSQVLSDNYAGAVDVAIEFVEQLGERGRYVELLGIVTDNNTWNRSKGFHSVVDRYPGLEMIAQQSAEFDRSKALEVMESILQRSTSIDAVFCGNDAMALGAYQALLSAGLAGKVKVFGFDGSDDALASIAEGKLTATAMQYPKTMARMVAEFADRYLQGERNLPARLPIHVDLVTRGNIGEFGEHGRRGE